MAKGLGATRLASGAQGVGDGWLAGWIQVHELLMLTGELLHERAGYALVGSLAAYKKAVRLDKLVAGTYLGQGWAGGGGSHGPAALSLNP